MKLLLENWRKYLEKGYPGTGTPWERGGTGHGVDPSTVRVIEGPLFYGPRGGIKGQLYYLFVVVEYQRRGASGETKKVGLYRSTGSSVSGADYTAGMWFPVYGIDLAKDGWIIKYEDKYPHPDSELGVVTKTLGQSAMAQQGAALARRLGGKERHVKRRSLGLGTDEMIDYEAKEINAMFAKHGVNK